MSMYFFDFIDGNPVVAEDSVMGPPDNRIKSYKFSILSKFDPLKSMTPPKSLRVEISEGIIHDLKKVDESAEKILFDTIRNEISFELDREKKKCKA